MLIVRSTVESEVNITEFRVVVYGQLSIHSCLALFSLNPISIEYSHAISLACLELKEFNPSFLSQLFILDTFYSSNFRRRS